jgi:hypothetical protein
MGKASYSPGILSAYSVKRSNRSFVFSLLILVGLLLFVIYCFLGGSESSKVEKTEPLDFQAVDHDLAHNLQWLNEPVLTTHPEKPIHVFKRVIHQLDKNRLAANSLVYESSASKTVPSKVTRVEKNGGSNRLVAGEVLHAVLESAIQSDFAGPVRAILSEPAYAYRSRHVLLPAGTRVIGEYQNSIRSTQVRVGMRWQRMVLPGGDSVSFDAPATDPMGRVGIKASRVNSHFWKRFGEAGLYSLLSAGAQLSGGLDASTLTAGQMLGSQVAGSFADTAMSDLEKSKDISPTIYLDPGAEISIFVRRDIIF